MSADHKYSWIAVMRDGTAHQVDAETLRFDQGFAIWERDHKESQYVACAMPLADVQMIDIMSQLTGYPSQRTLLDLPGRKA